MVSVEVLTGVMTTNIFVRTSTEDQPDVVHLIWASSRENLSSVVCEQQRHRPACAYAQSDQRLYCSLIVKYHI